MNYKFYPLLLFVFLIFLGCNNHNKNLKKVNNNYGLDTLFLGEKGYNKYSKLLSKDIVTISYDNVIREGDSFNDTFLYDVKFDWISFSSLNEKIVAYKFVASSIDSLNQKKFKRNAFSNFGKPKEILDMDNKNISRYNWLGSKITLELVNNFEDEKMFFFLKDSQASTLIDSLNSRKEEEIKSKLVKSNNFNYDYFSDIELFDFLKSYNIEIDRVEKEYGGYQFYSLYQEKFFNSFITNFLGVKKNQKLFQNHVSDPNLCCNFTFGQEKELKEFFIIVGDEYYDQVFQKIKNRLGQPTYYISDFTHQNLQKGYYWINENGKDLHLRKDQYRSFLRIQNFPLTKFLIDKEYYNLEPTIY